MVFETIWNCKESFWKTMSLKQCILTVFKTILELQRTFWKQCC